MLEKLHARLGDFWWYSLMLFCACRAADLMNAFVGLWLVPKYVDPSELGAVMPLTQFANFLAIPVAAFANTFRNELTRLSIGREFGKLKTLMRGVFVATAVFLFLSIVVARFLLPAFLERIRIVEGSLGLVIIVASFVSAISPIYSNALQTLKKFKAQSILSIVGAPVRLLTMLVAMPFRAITGYFVGQASTPVFSIIASVFSLRKELSIKAEPYWSKGTIRKFSSLLALFSVSGVIGGVYGLVESTVLRQRLPDIDSAGYYMASRFSEIASYLFCAINFTLFPMAADLSNRSLERRRLVVKALLANFAFCAFVGIASALFGRQLLGFMPHGDQYAAYWWAVPWLTAITAITSVQGFYTTAEIAAGRFGFMKWLIPVDIAYPILLLVVTGHGYFTGIIPTSWTVFLETHNIRSLDTMLWWMTAVNILKASGFLTAMYMPMSPLSVFARGGGNSRKPLLRIAQYINRNTTWLGGIKRRLGLLRIAEKCLVRPLKNTEIQSIRESLRTDLVTHKIQALIDSGVARIHFYIFLFQSIGDIVANEPIPRHLKTLAPMGVVHWIVCRNFKAILEANPYIDDIIAVNSFGEGEDLCHVLSKTTTHIIIDCHFNGIAFDPKRAPHKNPANPAITIYTHFYFGPILSTFSLAAGLPPLDNAPLFHLRRGIVRPDFGVARYIVFHCKSNELAKDWPKTKWNRLAESLACNGFTIVEIGTKRVITENYHGRIVDYTGPRDLQELATIVRNAQLFIGVDSAFGHMANCFMTPSIILLGKYKNFDTYLPYSGPFPHSRNFTIIRAPSGRPASCVNYDQVLTAAKKKLCLLHNNTLTR